MAEYAGGASSAKRQRSQTLFFSFVRIAFRDDIPGSANGLFGANVFLDSLLSEFLSESPRNLSLMLPRNDDLLMM